MTIENKKSTVWQVVDTSTSRGLPSERKVVAEFETLKEATEFSRQTDEFRVRPQPEKRSKKDDANDQ